ncbi:ZIP family metal transporter [Dokdonella koreensis]|uniref:Metal transporter, ZIP family n=1 Tax=Dokdonella koreensis DS-123 TaxID=1300342 RepID=A0A160DSF6_9GAMM|nr:ZIP family metal transporter [Dokdonella koreensis]ANB17195.1 Metal transporter, ZIP family [Dokdonella koreensis DS-123]
MRIASSRFPSSLSGPLAAALVVAAVLLGYAAADLDPPLQHALQAGGLCALGTALGALPVLVVRTLPQAVADGLLGFGAGVMLAATAFSLIVPGLDATRDLGATPWQAGGLVSAGLLLGASGLVAVEHLLPHDRLGPSVPGSPLVPARIVLFVIAIVAHNIPEGMAVGVAAGAALPEARGLTLGIALQDMPEGLVVALVLAGAGLTRGKALLAGAASGLVEPIAAVASAWLAGLTAIALPWGLALAAGAMLIAVVQVIVPESYRNGHVAAASAGLCLGFCLMMVMDTALAL